MRTHYADVGAGTVQPVRRNISDESVINMCEPAVEYFLKESLTKWDSKRLSGTLQRAAGGRFPLGHL